MRKIALLFLFGAMARIPLCYADAVVTGTVSNIRTDDIPSAITTTVSINTADSNTCSGVFTLFPNSGQMMLLLVTAGNLHENLTISYTNECKITSVTIN